MINSDTSYLKDVVLTNPNSAQITLSKPCLKGANVRQESDRAPLTSMPCRRCETFLRRLATAEVCLYLNGMTTVDQLRELPVEDRLQIVGDLWDSIAEDSSTIKLTPAQISELDRRLDDLEKNPNEGRAWDEVRADIEKRL